MKKKGRNTQLTVKNLMERGLGGGLRCSVKGKNIDEMRELL